MCPKCKGRLGKKGVGIPKGGPQEWLTSLKALVGDVVAFGLLK